MYWISLKPHLARAHSSSGNGTLSHMLMEDFKRRADIRIMHVPYQGSARAVTDLVAGTVQVYVFPPVRPVTTIGLAVPPFEPAAPPSDDVHDAVYPVIGLPPFHVGGVNATDVEVTPDVAVAPVGANGAVGGAVGRRIVRNS